MTNCQGAFSSDNIYASSSGWYYSDWPYRKKITISSTKVTADLSDFPVLINITDPDLRDHAQDDGDDILFTHADGITKLSHEIERFDGTTGELVAWVNVTSISSTVDTMIYMYYGHGTAGNQEDPTGVWDSGYAGVYHLGEVPDGTVDDVRDSTQNANHGTSSGMISANQVAGQIGGGLSFEIADSVTVSDNASLEFEQAGSVAVWFNSDVALNFVPGGDTPTYRVLVNREYSFFLYYDSADGAFQLRVYQAGGYMDYHTRLDGSGPKSVPAGEWHHVAFTFNKTHGWAYYDGASRGDADSAFSGKDFREGGAMTVRGADWDGKLDEVRVSDIASASARSAGWIATAYSNQNDTSTFYSVGVEERPAVDTAWKDFGFNLNATDAINQVEIGVEWFRDNAAPILNVTISWDGGITWAANQTATNRSTDDDTLQFLDLTSAVFWTPSMLDAPGLRARAGTDASGAHLDHIVVRVTFTPASPPGPDTAPVVVTLEATIVTRDTAILRGNAGDLGSATYVQVSFEWGTSPALGRETTPVTLSAPAPFEVTIEELTPGTTYYYRAKTTGNGTALGETLTFQTVPAALVLDGLSQLSFYLAFAAVAIILAYFLTRKYVGSRRRQRLARSPPTGTGEVVASLRGLLAKAGSFSGLVGLGRGKAQAGGHGAPTAAPTTMEVVCPHCGTVPEGEAIYCFGCSQDLTEIAGYIKEVERAKAALEQNARNQNAPFIVGAHRAVADEEQEAIEMLNSLEEAAGMASSEATEDEGSAGLGSCPYCGTTVEPETGNCPECIGSVLGEGKALEEKMTRVLATLEPDENDAEALFTLGTYLLLDGKAQKALDTLNRLTLLDPDYPGLWRAKALIFEKLGNKNAAESALVQAQRRSAAFSGDAE